MARSGEEFGIEAGPGIIANGRGIVNNHPASLLDTPNLTAYNEALAPSHFPLGELCKGIGVPLRRMFDLIEVNFCESLDPK